MFVLRKLESLTPQLPLRLPNVRNRPSSTMEVRSFEEINEVMDSSPIQYYISSLHGSVNAGEAVLLDKELLLPADLPSKVATIIRKQESPSGFIVNFYVFPSQMALKFPAYVGFSAQEVIQTQYLSVVSEVRFKTLVYLIREGAILSGRKAFCVRMSDCFFTTSSDHGPRGRTSEGLLCTTGLSESHATNLVNSVEIVSSDHRGSKHEEPQLGLQAS
jgi:hypothetical protein